MYHLYKGYKESVKAFVGSNKFLSSLESKKGEYHYSGCKTMSISVIWTEVISTKVN
jgi:hypothetical protein